MSRQNSIRGLLRNHHDGGHDKGTGDLGEDGGIDNTQTLGAADLEVAIEHRHGVVVRTDLVRARGVVAPGLVLDPLDELLVGVVLLRRPEDVGLAVDIGDILEEVLRHPNALDKGLGVLVGGLGVHPLVQVVEGDDGRVPRVGASQLDGSGVVARVRLQDKPRPPGLVVGRRGIRREARVEAVEERGEAADPQVLLPVVRVAGRPERAREHVVRRVHALGRAPVVRVRVARPTRVVLGAQERAVQHPREVGRVVSVHADFQPVLQVVAHAREVDDDGDTVLLESAKTVLVD